MFSSYQIGYVAGHVFTRVVKVYLVGKVTRNAFSKLGAISKNHKIDSKNADIVTENVFKCLEYLD
jgi:hypothetical protein